MSNLADPEGYVLGMNILQRYFLFFSFLLAMFFILKKLGRFEHFQETNLIFGLLGVFSCLILLSVFGNYQELTAWRAADQFEFLPYSILLFLLSAGSLYLGLKKDREILSIFWNLVYFFKSLCPILRIFLGFTP